MVVSQAISQLMGNFQTLAGNTSAAEVVWRCWEKGNQMEKDLIMHELNNKVCFITILLKYFLNFQLVSLKPACSFSSVSYDQQNLSKSSTQDLLDAKSNSLKNILGTATTMCMVCDYKYFLCFY
jgi:hypothetical protein